MTYEEYREEGIEELIAMNLDKDVYIEDLKEECDQLTYKVKELEQKLKFQTAPQAK